VTAISINYPVTQRALEVGEQVVEGTYSAVDALPLVEAATERVPDRILGREARRHAQQAHDVAVLIALHLLGAGTFKAAPLTEETATDAESEEISALARLSGAYTALSKRIADALGGERPSS
jgi:hypothetical protein